jgi:tyrosyl-tRNA synthetase
MAERIKDSPLVQDLNEIGMDVGELFVRAGLVKSKNEARNQIRNGGLRIQNRKITDPFARIVLNRDTNELIIIERTSK